MNNYVPSLLPSIQSQRLPGIEFTQDTQFPCYNGQSIANLPASICQWLGISPFGSKPLLHAYHDPLNKTFRHVVLLLVDGLGLDWFQRSCINPAITQNELQNLWQHTMGDAALFPLTSVVPSTTSTALTTFWTGRTPYEHGIVGYEMWLREYSMIANMILHSPAAAQSDIGGLRKAGFTPETFLPVPTLAGYLLQNGIHPFAHQHLSIARSGLSAMLLPQADLIPYRTLSDLWVTLDAILTGRTDESTYSYVYWGELDDLEHRYGPEDERVFLEFLSFSQGLERFIRRLSAVSRGDTLLLITADHGQIYNRREAVYELRFHPELMQDLVMEPSGEARLAYLYLRPGKEQHALEYIHRTWPEQFHMIPSAQAVEAGLFGSGSLHPRLLDRVGDWIVAARDGQYLWWAQKENLMQGRHGGLTSTEMLVPLIALPL